MKTSDNVIKWGIIGLGKIANKFAQDLLTVDNCELVAVASRNQERSDAFAGTYGAQNAYGSYEQLAKDPNVDAVYIATPHSYHKEHSILCLSHQKAVLCEKPFAMNSQEVLEMMASAKANDTLLMEALWTYFLPHYQHVLKMLKENTYGKLLKMNADFGFYKDFDNESRLFKKTLGGGSLLDIGIYPIFAALTTLGAPKSIEASATFFDNGADSTCSMVFHYEDGVEAHLKSTLLEETPTVAEFYCEKGLIKINGRFHEPSTVTLIPNEGAPETLDFNYNSIGYNFETMHFNDLIRQGKKESDLMTFEFSKQLIGTLDKVASIIGLEY
ncbi:Gfo/Idh/MocA family protein [Mangrovimonas sp. YM274]|uniref:Gfo/Idh/MocA family protein n=1 Tax=Mangrovimonas sp. YM274 TaxID=3070660 RepID=UPI0027DCC36A|nr:Gfo/Idh/MocA family oxidoreductase [Mangrovimonas sp. YM274]WMI70111.1 Gfo/Idh/MocA family oxidoreductase [Mangrovimonas sp. YM274]